MIEVKELRIGNYVTINNPEFRPELKGVLFKVNGIANMQLELGYSVNLSFINDTENKFCERPSQRDEFLGPIVFDEEWKNKFDLTLFPFEIFGDNNRGFHIDLGGEWLLLKHVHQLQNLFQSLTNQELTINEQQ